MKVSTKMLALSALSLALVAAAPVAMAAVIADLPIPVKPAKPYHFDLITKSNASPYWLAVRDGADAAAKKFGVSVSFTAPVSGLDLAAQIAMVDNAVTAKPAGIILAAQNPKALLGPVRNALNHHIPLVTVDSGVSPNISDCFLATSNIKAAAHLAEYTAVHLMHKKGQYAIIDYNHTSSTGIERPAGFMKGMKAYPSIQKMGPIQYADNSVSKGIRITNDLLTQYPKLKVIYGANDRSALAPAEAIARTHSKVRVVGFDADLGEIKYIKNGTIQASILQAPYDMGYYAVVALLDKIAGKAIPKRIATPYMLVTPHNVNTKQATKMIQQYIPAYKQTA
ncbi:substrate-binding domain-containing protein [Acidithiobacillus sp. M4-SHS-6]|uniref:substrate-binding domain-containing protein n=1 Tax=Acidithiobacillus sp. M4-SHS-6 TaxID=3383024 RepID=UPI0039BE36C2